MLRTTRKPSKWVGMGKLAFGAALGLALLLGPVGSCPATTASATPIHIEPGGFTPPPIKVAIVYSQTTMDWLSNRGTPTRYPHADKESELLYYLQHRGYNVTQIVGDRDLLDPAALAQYDVVILPSMYALGTGASQSLARYVANGGGLVSTLSSPRIDPAHAGKVGTTDYPQAWWWHVMNSNAWEWGPLSSVYQASFVNDGTYTPVFNLIPNPQSPLVVQAQAILKARGFDDSLAGVTILRDPGVSIEMSLPLARDPAIQSAASFNILTPSVKQLYPKTYTAILGTQFGRGRSVKFFFEPIDYLQNFSTVHYSVLTPTGFPQGEADEALVEGAIIWAGTHGTTSVQSIRATTVESAWVRKGTVKVFQTVRNTGTALVRGTVHCVLKNPSGHLIKTWSVKDVSLAPGGRRDFTVHIGKKLGKGKYRVYGSYRVMYPFDGAIFSSKSR